MISYKKISGLVFILSGIVLLLQSIKVLEDDMSRAVGTAFLLQGLASVYLSFKTGRRDFLFLFTVVFLIGIILITSSYFEIIESRGLVFSSILFIAGAGFFILFVDNPPEKKFLYTGVILALSGIASITFLRELGIAGLANKLGNAAEDFWPVILTLAGLVLFLNRNK